MKERIFPNWYKVWCIASALFLMAALAALANYASSKGIEFFNESEFRQATWKDILTGGNPFPGAFAFIFVILSLFGPIILLPLFVWKWWHRNSKDSHTTSDRTG